MKTGIKLCGPVDTAYLMHCGNVARIIASIERPMGMYAEQELRWRLRMYADITSAPIDFNAEPKSE
jgi:hypothetical protein